MIAEQCISVTDLKKNASAYIKALKKEWSKIIFVNNSPVAVLVDIDNFDLHIEEPFHFNFPDGLDPKVILDHFQK
jgi:prevent-host-death family protein